MRAELIQPAATLAAVAVQRLQAEGAPITEDAIKKAFIEAYRALQAASKDLHEGGQAKIDPLRM